MKWIELQLKLPEYVKDSIVNHLFELGALGVSDDALQEQQRVEEESQQNLESSICAYFSEEGFGTIPEKLSQYLEAIQEIYPKCPKIDLRYKKIEEENWSEKYKEFYFSQKISKRFFLRPEWDVNTEIPEGFFPIFMNPGQAFGTGIHPSTKLCIQLLEELAEKEIDFNSYHLLDVGTGSGILSIVASKLGVKEVTGIDVDPIAIETAKQNAKLNHVDDLHFSLTPVKMIKETYDIIVSNILLETHLELASLYFSHLKKGGKLILSGLLGSQKLHILEEMKKHGFIYNSARASQEWLALVLYRQ